MADGNGRSAPARGLGRRVAVIGSGVAGLTTAHVLRHTDSVSLYEADDRLGGHAHTHDIPSADGGVQRIDSGFIVHNARTYPLLLRLFRELGVRTQRPGYAAYAARTSGFFPMPPRGDEGDVEDVENKEDGRT